MIGNIQVLRAFAAINVVFFHIIGTSATYSLPVSFFQFLEGWGANGVDIFFVISGFVMLHTQLLKRKTPFAFFKSRLIRIVPIYWALTLFFAALFYLFPSLFREMVVTPLWLISSLFFSAALVAGAFPIVHVGWTLEWEMLFYLVFAVALFLPSWRAFGGAVVALLTLIAVCTQGWLVFEFLLGMAVACIYHHYRFSGRFGAVVFLVGALALVLSLLVAVRALALDRFFIWGLPSFLIVLGVLYAPQLRNRLLAYLGDASYSIYLVQMLAIPAFYKVARMVLAGWNTDVLALACLVVSVVAGCVMYSLIEKPLTVRLRRFV
jgi:peptidoglycan/LPS O-acetylase OafA/YrhL